MRLAVALFLTVVLLLLFVGAMGRNLNHDEHQFLAPGAVLARDGALPYRDYPLFHLPNLVFVYAALDQIWDRPMMVARCFSALCAFGTALLIFRQCWQTPPFGLARWRFVAACGAVIFLIFDPLFIFTTGRTWNHDLPALLTVLAVLMQVKAAQRSSLAWSATSAVCAGLAVGTRLTYAPILIPLWASNWILPVPLRQRIIFAFTYVAGATAALGPSLYYFFAHRDQFLFGNFEFPRLRLLDPDNERIRKTMHPLRKLRFFFKEVALPSLPLFLAYAFFGIRSGWNGIRGRPSQSFGAALVFGILPFALLGCFAPSRYQYQHFFIIAPLLVLGVVFGASGVSTKRQRSAILLSLLCITSFFVGIYKSSMPLSLRSSEWFPNRIRTYGQDIRKYVADGKVLTLAPAIPQEAGLQTYPEFATAPFAWKCARFVSPERRARMKLIAPEDLQAFVTTQPPAAILTGVEDKALEKPFVDYARAAGFRSIPLGKERLLWLPSEKRP
jgi:hypothetical protein